MAKNAKQLINSLESAVTVNFAVSVDKYLGVEEAYIRYLRERDRFFFQTQVSQQQVLLLKRNFINQLMKEDPSLGIRLPGKKKDKKQEELECERVRVRERAREREAQEQANRGTRETAPSVSTPVPIPVPVPLPQPKGQESPQQAPAPTPVPPRVSPPPTPVVPPIAVPKRRPQWQPTEFERKLMESDKPVPIDTWTDPSEWIAGGVFGKLFKGFGLLRNLLPKAAPRVVPAGSKIVPFTRPQVPAVNNITSFARPKVRMAEGALATGPTNALIAEAGEPEVVMPLSKLGDSLSGPTKELGAMLTGLASSFVSGFPINSPALSAVTGDIAKSRRKFGEDKNAARLFGGGKIAGLTDNLFKVFASLSGVGMIGDAVGKLVGLVQQPQPNLPPGPESGDFWLLSVAALFENSDPQGAADVAQAIYNRVAFPGWPKSIRGVILAPNQFQPTRQYGGVQEWSAIVDEASAKAFVQRHGKTPEMLDRVAQALRDPSKQSSARAFVGARDNFRADSYERANNHLEDSTEVSRLGHTFGMEAGGANYAAYKAGKLSPGGVPTFTAPGQTPGSQTPPTGNGSWNFSSAWGWRKHPKSGQWKFHNGVDVSAGPGKPWGTRFPAQVLWAGDKGDGYGYSVVLRYSTGAETRWGHFKSQPPVRTGQVIPANTIVGYEGNTGISTGEHLHLELYPRGNAFSYSSSNTINPLSHVDTVAFVGAGSGGGRVGGGRGGGKINLKPPQSSSLDLQSSRLNSMGGGMSYIPVPVPVPVPVQSPPQIIPIPMGKSNKPSQYYITPTNKAARVR